MKTYTNKYQPSSAEGSASAEYIITGYACTDNSKLQTIVAKQRLWPVRYIHVPIDLNHHTYFFPIKHSVMNLHELHNITTGLGNTPATPVLFIGHGSPMNAIYDNAYTRHLNALGKTFDPKPNAILVISAHWLTQGTHVMVSPKPKTIHDFGGFPEELYNIQYPALGSPFFAAETRKMITTTTVTDDNNWGLDHGTWTVLRHMFPNADIPVYQLSIDHNKPPLYHYNLARELSALRKKGVLILGSGNIVHNLYQISFDTNAKPLDWAIEFDELVKTKLNARAFDDLVNYQTLGTAAKLSIPTNDHYLPMLYALGLADKTDELKFTFEEIQNGSISMRSFQVGL